MKILSFDYFLFFLIFSFIPALSWENSSLHAGVGDHLIYYPDRKSFAECSSAKEFGFIVQDILHEGERLRFYWKRSPQMAKATFLYFHGNAGNACQRIEMLQPLFTLPYHFILAEYPGYAGDQASPREKKILHNALSLSQWHEKEEPGKVLIVAGESLGSSVATYIASQKKVVGLVLTSPFPSIPKVAKTVIPFLPLPVKWLFKDRFPAEDWAKSVHCPVLILHGDKDRTISLDLGQEQGKNFKGKVSFKIIQGADHNDMINFPQYWKEFEAFIRSLVF